MPVVPPAATKLLKLAEGDDHDRILLHRSLGKDFALSTAILRIANGPTFGNGHFHANLEEVTESFGSGFLARMAFAVSLNGLVRHLPARRFFDPTRASESGIYISFLTAGLAQKSAQYSSHTLTAEEMFALAIARDIHVSTLTRAAPEVYDGIADFACLRQLDFREGFESILGSPMEKLAQGLARAWRLPSLFAEAAGCCDVPGDKPLNNRVAAIILMAESVARKRSITFEPWRFQSKVRPELQPLVGLSDWDINALAAQAEQEAIEFLRPLERVAA